MIEKISKFFQRFVIQLELTLRFDRPCFSLEKTWNEKELREHYKAIWWPRCIVTIFWFSIGFALFWAKPETYRLPRS